MRNLDVGKRIDSDAKPASKEKLVSNQSAFLNQIGVLEKEKKTNHLTEIGHEIARAIDYGLDDEFVEKMSRQLWQWSEGKSILDYVYYTAQVGEQVLLERTVADAGKSMETTNASLGSQTLVDLFVRVNILEKLNGSIKMTDNTRREYESLYGP